MSAIASTHDCDSAAIASDSSGRSARKVSILLVDDHAVVRQGLSALLKMEDDIEVVGEAENGRTAVALARGTLPDVVIMDVSMPLLNGAEATRQIRKAVPSARVLALSSYDDDEFVEHLMQAGASGYLTKDAAAEELIRAVRAVHGGRNYFSQAIDQRLQRRFREKLADGKPLSLQPKLTSRQVEVLQLIAEGFANKQIAAELNISIKTVEKHRQQLMHNLGVHDIAGLTRHAVATGLVECKETHSFNTGKEAGENKP